MATRILNPDIITDRYTHGWSRIELYPKHLQVNQEMIDWVKSNLDGEYFYKYYTCIITEIDRQPRHEGRIYFKFQLESDAMAFKLRYC